MSNRTYKEFTLITKLKKYYIYIPFLLGILCFIISGIKEPNFEVNGLINEPLFFLIPTGYILFLIGILLIIIKLIYKIIMQKRNNKIL